VRRVNEEESPTACVPTVRNNIGKPELGDHARDEIQRFIVRVHQHLAVFTIYTTPLVIYSNDNSTTSPASHPVISFRAAWLGDIVTSAIMASYGSPCTSASAPTGRASYLPGRQMGVLSDN